MDHIEFERISLAVHHQKAAEGRKAVDFAIFPLLHLEQAIIKGKRYFDEQAHLKQWFPPVSLFMTGLIQKLNGNDYWRSIRRNAAIRCGEDRGGKDARVDANARENEQGVDAMGEDAEEVGEDDDGDSDAEPVEDSAEAVEDDSDEEHSSAEAAMDDRERNANALVGVRGQGEAEPEGEGLDVNQLAEIPPPIALSAKESKLVKHRMTNKDFKT